MYSSRQSEGSLSCLNDVSPQFLGVTSLGPFIPHPYKVLHNAPATVRMTRCFVFVTCRHRQSEETQTLRAGT